ncbi:IGHMBP2 family helicase [Ekhidna sp.]|uniref:IGHMBP2 family helicase n=1 Tax=Ekhidna sp. TaxID=2608089 RepID=UPI003B50AE8F
MTSQEITDSFQHQIELLKKEKNADYALYQERMMNTSIQEREKNGVTWYPIQMVSDFISTGERITVEIRKQKNVKQKHAFQVGAVVGIFSGSDEKEKTLGGVVSYLKEDTMRIVLNQSFLPDWVKEAKLGINLLFDDGTYREMNKALHQVSHAKNDRLAELRNIFYGLKQANFEKGHSYKIPSLNDVQNKAFEKIIHAHDVAFVHGPPGTGKTTTLVKCIKEITREERQVLVCAPSNAAVDLLVERLISEGLNVLRLGHPARLTPEVVENSLDVRISKHPDFNRLREMRKQSEEYRNLAGKYKRSFGREEKKQRDMLYKEAKALKSESRHLENYISESLADKAEVIACTLTGSSHSLISDRLFKTVFVDESSQALEAAAWIPITRAQRVIMSGDHYQLPPTIKSFEAAKEGLEDTLFAKGLEAQASSVTMLEVQYRMNPKIMGFSSEQFYKGKLKADQSILLRPKHFDHVVSMIDTAGAGYAEKIKQETLSTYNEQEAEVLIRLLEKEKLEGLSVGVIAPYKAQVEVLTHLLNQSEKLAHHREMIDINSVDAFQGQERDVIYISLVRSNNEGVIGFLKEYRRLNVAITRARHRLVIIGDSSTLGIDNFYSKLIEYIQINGHYASVYEYPELMEYT